MFCQICCIEYYICWRLEGRQETSYIVDTIDVNNCTVDNVPVTDDISPDVSHKKY